MKGISVLTIAALWLCSSWAQNSVGSQIPGGLTKRQGEFYVRLRDILADGPNRFADLARDSKRRSTRPDGSIDLQVSELLKPLPGFDYGGVTDPSSIEDFIYFEGTPVDWIRVFEDYRQAARALMPGSHEEPFQASNWRISDGHYQISLRRDEKIYWGRSLPIYRTVVMTIVKVG